MVIGMEAEKEGGSSGCGVEVNAVDRDRWITVSISVFF